MPSLETNDRKALVLGTLRIQTGESVVSGQPAHGIISCPLSDQSQPQTTHNVQDEEVAQLQDIDHSCLIHGVWSPEQKS